MWLYRRQTLRAMNRAAGELQPQSGETEEIENANIPPLVIHTIYIDENIMAHANHYVSRPMRRFEANRNYIGGSILRHNRALRLLRENYGRLTPEVLKKLLAEHANYPASICKHEGTTVTVFSIIVKFDELKAWIGKGRPCQTCWQELALEPFCERFTDKTT
jgi:hypothetical protein